MFRAYHSLERPKLLTCATIPVTSPVLAGRISVLLVLANDWKAVTYFSATAKLAAFCPLSEHSDLDTISIERARA